MLRVQKTKRKIQENNILLNISEEGKNNLKKMSVLMIAFKKNHIEYLWNSLLVFAFFFQFMITQRILSL